MPIQNISTANTFYQWTVLTQKLVPEVSRRFVDFTDNPVYSNTNINFLHDANTQNIIINGNFTLSSLNKVTLNVASNVEVQGNVEAHEGIFSELHTTNTLSIINVTTIYLTTSNIRSSNLNVTSNAVFSNTLNLNTFNVATSNIYSLRGIAYNNILNTVNSSNAYVFTQDNISSFIAYTIGLG